jgi:long chain fatty acid CoA FadD26
MTMPHTLVGRLRHWATVAGDRPAVTFVDYSADRAGDRRTVTWSELSARVDSTAALLRHRPPGERVAIMVPQGLEYVVAFLGALRAGMVAVPLFSPLLRGHDTRLHAVLADCASSAVLTTANSAPAVEKFLESEPKYGTRPVVLTVDGTERAPSGFTPPDVAPDDVAYLQYTSGSTRTPAGVVLTHRTVTSNSEQVMGAFRLESGRSRIVSWLPLFHDMGLMLGVLEPVFAGLHSIILDPVAFVERPVRWLRLLTEYPEALTAAPNFAFDYCVRRVRDDDRRHLRLDRVLAVVNGSEPIVPSVVESFNRAFLHCGLRPDACRPSYGLAEATVFVTTGPAVPPRTTAFDRDALAAGRAVAVPAGGTAAVQLVGCGTPFGQQVAIVDPDTARVRPAGQVGEI